MIRSDSGISSIDPPMKLSERHPHPMQLLVIWCPQGLVGLKLLGEEDEGLPLLCGWVLLFQDCPIACIRRICGDSDLPGRVRMYQLCVSGQHFLSVPYSSGVHLKAFGASVVAS